MSTHRILLIERDEGLRTILKVSLELFGYEVLAATTAPQALDLLRQQPGPIALVINDLVMPHMNALQLYEALQEHQQDVKMLILTNYPMPHTGMSLVQRPGVRWMRKPIHIDTLAALVRTMLPTQ